MTRRIVARNALGQVTSEKLPRVTCTCETCGGHFELLPSRVARGDGRFCSKRCIRYGTLEERFFKKVDRDGPTPAHVPHIGPCHVWRGLPAVGSKRYGSFRIGGRTEKAHRVAFYLAHGRWPQPQALHRCDNRACVRREHLFEGDDTANARDREEKQRGNHDTIRGIGNPQAKLTEDDVRQIRSSNESQRALARRFGVSRQVIKAVQRHETWRHVS